MKWSSHGNQSAFISIAAKSNPCFSPLPSPCWSFYSHVLEHPQELTELFFRFLSLLSVPLTLQGWLWAGIQWCWRCWGCSSSCPEGSSCSSSRGSLAQSPSGPTILLRWVHRKSCGCSHAPPAHFVVYNADWSHRVKYDALCQFWLFPHGVK